MFNMPLGSVRKPGGLKLIRTHQLLMWAKLSGIKLNTEVVLVNSKESGVETNAGKTWYMFMCFISI
jgi:hypothetical protein